MFKKYESLPVSVEAVRFTEKEKDRVFNSLTGQHAPGFEGDKEIIKVKTIHGDTVIVRYGDWIVKEKTDGMYYPVANDVFCNKYELKND